MQRSATSTTLITADAVTCAKVSIPGNRQAPAALLVEHDAQSRRILAVGTLADVQAHPATDSAARIDRPGCVLMPAHVNAHTHLDLTHIGTQPHDPGAGFTSWIGMVLANRLSDPAQIRASVAEGCRLLRKGGVGLVGDIAGVAGGQPSLEPWQSLAESGLAGVSYLEFFAIGTRTEASIERVATIVFSVDAFTRGSVRLGLQPHAPNTVAPEAYEAASVLARRFKLPLITHLAESPEESEFIAEGTGPQLELLQNLGIWNKLSTYKFGKGLSPVWHLERFIRSSGSSVVHVNECSDADLAILADARTRVVYCPRASAYFGAERHFGPHRYRDMLAAGLEVALGTDSVINLPSGVLDEAGLGLGTLDEARFLHARDGTDPDTLVRMITTHGSRVLGFDDDSVTLAEGATPIGILAIPASGEGSPAKWVMESKAAPEFLLGRN
ncbi:MAG: amidohydrolase family protein [Phycisphaerales bacterium]|nr:amidohydrolase family protein [Phycisphaerales bacterium]MCB9835505.1 amidohydrolase family protein [Phycisphaera sp.]